MAEYLSKEEIKQWRSSLEKITLEEFAARLGKKIEEKKETNDLVDIVLHGKPVVSSEKEWTSQNERLSSIANRAYEKEKDIYLSPFSVKNLQLDTKTTDKKQSSQKSVQSKKTVAKKADKPALTKAKNVVKEKVSDEVRNEVRVVFKKALTERKQKVFDYFSAKQDKIVYAKDLAELLELPRDYVYKYIKNLRAKIEGEALKNADKGGFILSLK
ncbi:hypothetical protein J6G99_09050 [bacterium]|nr:hypothetical protein [bacterium]